MQHCQKGFWRDAPDDLRCIQCSANCVECDSIENCFECSPGYHLYRGYCYLIPVNVAEAIISRPTWSL